METCKQQVTWDFQQPQQEVSNRTFFSRIVQSVPAVPLEVSFNHLKPGSYRLKVQRTGFRANDACSAYINMGAPKDLTPEQLDQLRTLTRDLPEIDGAVHVGNNGPYAFSLPMRSNDVVLVMLQKVKK